MTKLRDFMPTWMGRDYIKAIHVPLIVGFFFQAMLYLLSSIKEPTEDPNRNPIGIIYAFTWMTYPSIVNEILLFICIFISIWGGIRIVTFNGNLGDIMIGSFLLGLFYGFLDTLNFLIYFIAEYNEHEQEDPFDFSIYQDLLLTYWLYFVVISITTGLIFGAIYSEIINRDKVDKSLYPSNV
ncbi:MAG: hypothetical protein ACXAD7_15625 [Candidatus Kariarchaeaceae archaeon]|jgi:hypothetical protein